MLVAEHAARNTLQEKLYKLIINIMEFLIVKTIISCC